MTRDDRRRDDHEVAFIGRVTAGVSHEFMNVLATIRESSGLIEDLMVIDNTPFPFREKLSRTLATIRGQVNRGMEIGDRLNRFAHSTDSRIARLEINELLDRIASLMQRCAGMKRIEVRAESSGPRVEIETDPVVLQMVLAACIEYCLDRTSGGGVITLSFRREGDGITIGCTGNPGLAEMEDGGEQCHSALLYHDVLDQFQDNLSILSGQNNPGLELYLSL